MATQAQHATRCSSSTSRTPRRSSGSSSGWSTAARTRRSSAYRDAYLELIDLPPAAAVLDLGCGTGVVTRAIAARDGFAGTVTGVDQSPEFIAAARAARRRGGVGDRVEFVVGDVHALDLPAASFDAVVAHTLVSHVRDPLAVLAEAARVVRPGGSVAIFDGDYASLTFGSADAQLGRGDGARDPVDDHELAPGHARASAPAAGRPGCGWSPRRPTSTRRPDRAASCSTWPRRTGRWWPRPACCRAADVEAWLADQRRSAEDGTFFGACNYYAYVAARA